MNSKSVSLSLCAALIIGLFTGCASTQNKVTATTTSDLLGQDIGDSLFSAEQASEEVNVVKAEVKTVVNNGIVISDFQSYKQAPYSVVLDASPWGDQVPAIIEKQYYSASGLHCVRVNLDRDIKELLCSSDMQYWRLSTLLN